MAEAKGATNDGTAPFAPWPNPARAWYTICLISFVTMLANIDRNVIGLLIQPMKRDMHLTDTQVGLLTGMAFSLFYLLTGYPVSRISDVRSRKWVIAVGLTIWSIGTAICGLARSFWGMFAARGIVGASESMPGPAALSMMSDLVPPQRLPRAFAVYQLGIGAGQALALIIGGWLLGAFLTMGVNGNVELPLLGSFRAWQLVYVACGLPGLLVAVVWLTTVREPARRDRERQGSVPFREFLRYMMQHRRIFVPMFLGIAIQSIELFGIYQWRVPMFERTYGWAPQIAGPRFGYISIASMPFSLFAGTWLAEHLIKKRDPSSMLRIFVIGNSIYLPFAIAAPLMPDPWLCYAMLFVGTLVLGITGPAINSSIQFVTPNEMRGQVSSLYLITISVVGTWFGPLFIGLISDFILRDESLLRYAMSGFALVMGPAAILLMWLAMKPFGEEVRRRGVI